MQLDSPLTALHEAMASAVHRDLPDVEYNQNVWRKKVKTSADLQDYDVVRKKRRPFGSEIEVKLFSQMWGSTALGYGGIGGAAMTPAYTVIVYMKDTFCVYFGNYGVLAYKLYIDNLKTGQRKALTKALREEQMPARREALNMFKGAIEAPEREEDEDVI